MDNRDSGGFGFAGFGVLIGAAIGILALILLARPDTTATKAVTVHYPDLPWADQVKG